MRNYVASILPVANILHKLVPEGIITTEDIKEINDKPCKVKRKGIFNTEQNWQVSRGRY